LKQGGTSILLVTHSSEQIVTVPDDTSPEPSAAAVASRRLNYAEDIFSTQPNYNQHEYRWGDGKASILDFHLMADNVSFPSAIATGQKVTLDIAIRFRETLLRPIMGITIKTKEGVTVYGVNSETLDVDEFKSLGERGQAATVRTTFDCRLAPGDYFISIGVATKHGEDIIPHDRRYDAIHMHIRPEDSFFGLVDLGLELKAEEVSE
jgi:lipopolysaccharide transport system ATP-binding protein